MNEIRGEEEEKEVPAMLIIPMNQTIRGPTKVGSDQVPSKCVMSTIWTSGSKLKASFLDALQSFNFTFYLFRHHKNKNDKFQISIDGHG